MGIFNIKEKSALKIKYIPISLIESNPYQPRRTFDENEISQLAESIKENGLISPVSVRKCGERYQLIAGERRLLAFKLLCEKTIPAIVEQADDQKSAAMALVENLQRKNLNFYEEALAIAALIENQRLTQQQAAQKLGITQSAVANKLRILKLPEKILLKMSDANLGERHARALLPLADDKRLESAVEKIISQGLNVSQTEKMTAEMLTQKKPTRGGRILIIKDLRIFNTAITRAVDMMNQAGINAVSKKSEDEKNIIYTVTIPKKPEKRGFSA